MDIERHQRPPLARIWWLVGPLLVLCLAATVVAGFIHVNYILFAPGSAIATEPMIDVPKELSYETKGEVRYATVGVSQPRALEALYGWLHPDVDLFPRKIVNGDQSNEESRRLGRQMMDTSKLIASKVALERLGYEVEVSGTGVIVLDVEPGVPADGRLRRGDVIVALDGTPVELDDDLRRLVEDRKPGEKVKLTIERGEKREKSEIDIELAPRPENAEVPYIGIFIQTRDLDFDLPIDVRIESGEVGGPSAGLAFTLGILDRLTPGSITGGKTVVVTGAINPDGSVGPVGGVAQKVVAADEAGAVLFLVPANEYEEAVKVAGSDIRVEKVETLEQALEFLDSIGGNALDLGTPGRPGG